MQDVRTDCYIIDNDNSVKKLCECSNLSCSNTSVECEDILEKRTNLRRGLAMKIKPNRRRREHLEMHLNVYDDDGSNEASGGVEKESVTKGSGRRNRKRKLSDSLKSVEAANCSSLVELDLDWLFDDENERLQHCKGL